jgi:hypothetical protein
MWCLFPAPFFFWYFGGELVCFLERWVRVVRAPRLGLIFQGTGPKIHLYSLANISPSLCAGFSSPGQHRDLERPLQGQIVVAGRCSEAVAAAWAAMLQQTPDIPWVKVASERAMGLAACESDSSSKMSQRETGGRRKVPEDLWVPASCCGRADRGDG